ncbi:MAG: hypothetical protein HY276_02970 [Ignavibacteriales bacterium]|nr:hypothetical protein [Ignavibacteriales bacterium]MBI3787195.1 hypothetical protein [Ignavibacteriales bacterium]
MGQQQLLLIILALILVGIAIAAGISIFNAQRVKTNLDDIISDLNLLAANAYQYRGRPTTMSGGQGSYVGYVIPKTLASNESANYKISTQTVTSITIVATSVQNTTNTVTVVVDSDGKLGAWTYAGDFQ